MAKKAKHHKRNPHTAVARAKPRHRPPTHHRRNPPFSLSGILERVTSGAVGGITIVATEAGTRLVRSRALGMKAGTLASGATELALSTGAGILAERFLGRMTAQRIIDGGFASVIRATAKQLKLPLVSDALGDDSGGRNFIIRNGRVFPRRLQGYVPGRTINGYVAGANSASDIAAAAMMNNG